MTSTQIKKLNAYPEWNSLPTYIQVVNYIQSINEDEEPEVVNFQFFFVIIIKSISL